MVRRAMINRMRNRDMWIHSKANRPFGSHPPSRRTGARDNVSTQTRSSHRKTWGGIDKNMYRIGSFCRPPRDEMKSNVNFPFERLKTQKYSSTLFIKNKPHTGGDMFLERKP